LASHTNHGSALSMMPMENPDAPMGDSAKIVETFGGSLGACHMPIKSAEGRHKIAPVICKAIISGKSCANMLAARRHYLPANHFEVCVYKVCLYSCECIRRL